MAKAFQILVAGRDHQTGVERLRGVQPQRLHNVRDVVIVETKWPVLRRPCGSSRARPIDYVLAHPRPARRSRRTRMDEAISSRRMACGYTAGQEGGASRSVIRLVVNTNWGIRCTHTLGVIPAKAGRWILVRSATGVGRRPGLGRASQGIFSGCCCRRAGAGRVRPG